MQVTMRIYLLAIITSLLFVSCNKWKKPTDVQFKADINKSQTLNGRLSFNSGYLFIESFDYDGDREKGDDVIFNSEFVNGLQVPFDLNTSLTELQFMIPQGEYKRIDIGIRTFDNGTDPTILLEGVYEYIAGGTIPVRFEYEDSKQFGIRAEEDGGGNIILDKDVSSVAKIVMDPVYWFEVVPESYFESATITNLGGVNTIVINKSENDAIYNIVLNRLEETALVVFNY